MYHSKVVVLCWAVVYLFGIIAALVKKRWDGLRYILIGAAIVGTGIAASALLDSEVGALLLSAALLTAAYFTLIGIIKTFQNNFEE